MSKLSKFEVTYYDETSETIIIGQFDVLRAQEHFGKSFGEAGTDDIRMQSFAAHLALKRTNSDIDKFDDWLPTVAMIAPVKAGESQTPPVE